MLVGALLVTTTSPADAHEVGTTQSSNYVTTLDGIEPLVRGLTARVGTDQRIELRNTTRHIVEVTGYQGEQYLRIGRNGVWENRRSPAVFLNRTATPTEVPPGRYDAEADPVWKQISNGNVARWHEHRAHWMARTHTSGKSTNVHNEQVLISNWEIPLEWNSTELSITGDTLWVEGPSPLPWLFGAIALAIAVIAGSHTRAWSAIAGGVLGLLIITEMPHIGDSLIGSTAAIGSRVAASAYPITSIVIAVVTIVWIVRRGLPSAAPALLITGLFIAVTGGLGELSTLSSSQLATTLPYWWTRMGVMFAIGLGSGCLIASALHLRQSNPEPTRQTV